MRTFRFSARIGAVVLTFTTLLAVPQLASAISMWAYVPAPSQWGTGSAYYYGHTVSASTPYNILNAGGAFTVQCNHPATIPMTGERALASSTWGIDPNVLYVTIPEHLPAVRNLSGWPQIPGDTLISCNYRWTAFATEGGYSIGAGGISFQTGNGSMRDGGTLDFTMYRPSKEDADGGCAP